jgi:hypothetical protein
MAEHWSPTEVVNRRGCFILAAGAGLFLLLLIAISSGWLGHVDRFKDTKLPDMESNRT